ncbi:MAG: rhodanese-like domain-containing protein [Candidatus Poribacteria bacterium]|nr:rhodanese-like domain-containing protein [Candidatus Poribacteria bacterium]
MSNFLKIGILVAFSSFLSIGSLSFQNTDHLFHFRDIPPISLQAARWFFDRQGVVFLDARSHREYARGHIPRAINLSISNFEKQKTVLSNIPLSATIIVYCSGATCQSSLQVAEWTKGYLGDHRNVYVFLEGFPAWEKAKFPIAVEEDQ